MKITIGSTVLTATLENNSSVTALKNLLEKGPISIQMNDYGGMEKVGPLGSRIPTNDKHINTAPGDIILYQGTYLTIYYDANSWSLTRIGKIDNVSQDQLKKILGKGDVTVTFSLD